MRNGILALILLYTTCSCQKEDNNICKININVLEYKAGDKLPSKAMKVNLIVDKLTDENAMKYERIKSCYIDKDSTVSFSALNNTKLIIHAYRDSIEATNYITINKGEATINLIIK